MESAAHGGSFSPLLNQSQVPTQVISRVHEQSESAAHAMLEALSGNAMTALLQLGIRACDEIIVSIAGQEGVSAEAFHTVRIQQVGIRSYLQGLLDNAAQYQAGTHPIGDRAPQAKETETPIA